MGQVSQTEDNEEPHCLPAPTLGEGLYVSTPQSLIEQHRQEKLERRVNSIAQANVEGLEKLREELKRLRKDLVDVDRRAIKQAQSLQNKINNLEKSTEKLIDRNIELSKQNNLLYEQLHAARGNAGKASARRVVVHVPGRGQAAAFSADLGPSAATAGRSASMRSPTAPRSSAVTDSMPAATSSIDSVRPKRRT